MTLPAFPATIWTALWHSWHRPYLGRRRFRLHSHREIFIELVNQQQLPQSSSWHDRQGTEVGSSQDSGAVSQERLPPLWDRRYQPRYPRLPFGSPGRAATVRCLEGRCCQGFPPGDRSIVTEPRVFTGGGSGFSIKDPPRNNGGSPRAGKTSVVDVQQTKTLPPS